MMSTIDSPKWAHPFLVSRALCVLVRSVARVMTQLGSGQLDGGTGLLEYIAVCLLVTSLLLTAGNNASYHSCCHHRAQCCCLVGGDVIEGPLLKATSYKLVLLARACRSAYWDKRHGSCCLHAVTSLRVYCYEKGRTGREYPA